ncbi:MAG: hypothetical protein GXP31_16715 [Kiritimatiellaeota bacterium]|nr:hypothetical protein [Kiritimatiellota bacterium]
MSIAKLFVVGLLWGLATIRPLGAFVYTSTPFVKVVYAMGYSKQVITAYMVAMGLLFVSLRYSAFMVHGGINGAEPSRATQVRLIGVALCVYILVGFALRPLIAAEHQRRLTVGADMLFLPPLAMVLASTVAVVVMGFSVRRRQRKRSIEQSSSPAYPSGAADGPPGNAEK